MTTSKLHPVLALTALSALALTSCSGGGDGGGGNGGGEDEAQGPPQLSEIDDAMWDSMEAAESVRIEGDMSEVADADEVEQFFGDAGTMYFTGAMDGSFTTMGADEQPLMLIIGDETFIDGAVTASLAAEPMGEEVDTDQLEQELEGKWLDMSSEMGSGQDFDMGELITEGRQTWNEAQEGSDEGGDGEAQESEGTGSGEESSGAPSEAESGEGPFGRADYDQEGTAEERDGQEVWVYSNDAGHELVLNADEDSPYVVEITDDEATVTFTEWNEVEAPERPADEDIMDQAELQSILMDMMSQSQSEDQ